MTTFTKYRKAWFALFGYVTTGTLALSALAFLTGPNSHRLAVAAAISGVVLVPLFTSLAEPNTIPEPVASLELAPLGGPSRAEVLATEVRQLLADAELIRAAVTGPVATATYGPSRNDPSTVIGGVISPPGRLDVVSTA